MENVHPFDRLGVRAQIIKELGVSQQSITNWKAGLTPVIHCTAIERATDGEVRRWDLRPDDWHLIWPELIGADGAPSVEAKAA